MFCTSYKTRLSCIAHLTEVSCHVLHMSLKMVSNDSSIYEYPTIISFEKNSRFDGVRPEKAVMYCTFHMYSTSYSAKLSCIAHFTELCCHVLHILQS